MVICSYLRFLHRSIFECLSLLYLNHCKLMDTICLSLTLLQNCCFHVFVLGRSDFWTLVRYFIMCTHFQVFSKHRKCVANPRQVISKSKCKYGMQYSVPQTRTSVLKTFVHTSRCVANTENTKSKANTWKCSLDTVGVGVTLLPTLLKSLVNTEYGVGSVTLYKCFHNTLKVSTVHIYITLSKCFICSTLRSVL